MAAQVEILEQELEEQRLAIKDKDSHIAGLEEMLSEYKQLLDHVEQEKDILETETLAGE